MKDPRLVKTGRELVRSRVAFVKKLIRFAKGSIAGNKEEDAKFDAVFVSPSGRTVETAINQIQVMPEGGGGNLFLKNSFRCEQGLRSKEFGFSIIQNFVAPPGVHVVPTLKETEVVCNVWFFCDLWGHMKKWYLGGNTPMDTFGQLQQKVEDAYPGFGSKVHFDEQIHNWNDGFHLRTWEWKKVNESLRDQVFHQDVFDKVPRNGVVGVYGHSNSFRHWFPALHKTGRKIANAGIVATRATLKWTKTKNGHIDVDSQTLVLEPDNVVGPDVMQVKKQGQQPVEKKRIALMQFALSEKFEDAPVRFDDEIEFVNHDEEVSRSPNTKPVVSQSFLNTIANKFKFLKSARKVDQTNAEVTQTKISFDQDIWTSLDVYKSYATKNEVSKRVLQDNNDSKDSKLCKRCLRYKSLSTESIAFPAAGRPWQNQLCHDCYAEAKKARKQIKDDSTAFCKSYVNFIGADKLQSKFESKIKFAPHSSPTAKRQFQSAVKELLAKYQSVPIEHNLEEAVAGSLIKNGVLEALHKSPREALPHEPITKSFQQLNVHVEQIEESLQALNIDIQQMQPVGSFMGLKELLPKLNVQETAFGGRFVDFLQNEYDHQRSLDQNGDLNGGWNADSWCEKNPGLLFAN